MHLPFDQLRYSSAHLPNPAGESCCTCATLLSEVPRTRTDNEKPLPEDKKLACCERVICGKCQDSNERFAQYCPFCQTALSASVTRETTAQPEPEPEPRHPTHHRSVSPPPPPSSSPPPPHHLHEPVRVPAESLLDGDHDDHSAAPSFTTEPPPPPYSPPEAPQNQQNPDDPLSEKQQLEEYYAQESNINNNPAAKQKDPSTLPPSHLTPHPPPLKPQEPATTQDAAEDTLHFLHHDHDTIPSLSLRYNVPPAVLRRANNLTSDHLLAGRRTLLIPASHYKGGVSLSPRPVEGEDEERRKARIRKFMVGCRVSDYDVATLYLEQHGYDLGAAMDGYLADEAWERENPLHGGGGSSSERRKKASQNGSSSGSGDASSSSGGNGKKPGKGSGWMGFL